MPSGNIASTLCGVVHQKSSKYDYIDRILAHFAILYDQYSSDQFQIIIRIDYMSQC